MIHIADTKVARRYGDFFIRQIHKFEEVRFLYFIIKDLFIFVYIYIKYINKRVICVFSLHTRTILIPIF